MWRKHFFFLWLCRHSNLYDEHKYRFQTHSSKIWIQKSLASRREKRVSLKLFEKKKKRKSSWGYSHYPVFFGRKFSPSYFMQSSFPEFTSIYSPIYEVVFVYNTRGVAALSRLYILYIPFCNIYWAIHRRYILQSNRKNVFVQYIIVEIGYFLFIVLVIENEYYFISLDVIY